MSGQTDQNGEYVSQVIAPGKYFVLATNSSIDRSPETIEKLSRARTNAQQVNLEANGTVQISLSPVELE